MNTLALAWRRFRRSRLAVVGLVILACEVAAAVLAPWVAPHSPLEQSLLDRLQPPTGRHLFGTDNLGRDTLSRIIFGARYSLSVGFISIAIGLAVGGSIGMSAGYFGGWVDRLIASLIDVLMAFPGILLALSIVGILGPGLFNVMIAVGIWSIPIFARLARAAALQVRETEYVQAARALGARDRHTLLVHVLPNCVPSLIVISTLRMSTAILTAAGLSFLGLGAQPPTPEWGSMLNASREFLRDAPWVATFTGLTITLTVIAFNFVGDALRDALDPKLR